MDKKNLPKKEEKFPTLKLVQEKDIALDFAVKVYKKFDKLVKSIILFGSVVKKTNVASSDIDIIIIVDDVSIRFDQEFVAWYREELKKIVEENPYKQELHINTVKLSAWWQDLLKGDPVLINVVRYGEALIDFGGFFNPLKIMLQEGKIKPTPEAIYTCLQRAPMHLQRSRQAQLSSIEGIYWTMVDSAHALLIAAKISPPSPEHIPVLLKENFVDKKMIDSKYIGWYRDIFVLHKGIMHGEIKSIKGQNIDVLQQKAEEFMRKMAEVIEKIIKTD